MIRNRVLQGLLLSSALVGGPSIAGEATSAHARAHSSAELASLQLENDPFAKVYIVSSRTTYDRVKALARNGVVRSDSLGNALVVSEIQAYQLSVLSEDIHARELRCGGYFAFRTRADADAFIRNDRAASAVRQSLVASYTIDNQATVNPWLSQAGQARITDTITQLQSYQNRYYSSTTGKTSAEWIRTTWQGLASGRSDVSSELVTCSNCSTQPSVILTVQGTDLPNEVVVLGAHLDSISGSGGNTVAAPGADDDASGIATLTEVIRVALANGWKPKRTVKFMGYAAEEVGLRGSNAIATSFKNAGTNVVGVLQLDMTNYATGASTDMRLVSDYSNADLKTYFNQLFDAYLAPLGYTRGSYTCGYGCSDHASWTSAGYPAAMMFEGGGGTGYNPNIHSANDTLANMGGSAQASVKFAQFALAFLGEMGKTQGSGGGGGGTGGSLTKGVAVTGINQTAGNSVNYTMVVPSGASNLTFTMSGGTGDADMYVKFGSAPTDSSYDCRPYKSGNAETCTFATPSAGTYHVRLKSYTAFTGVSLVGDYTTGGGGGGSSQTYSNTTDVSIPDNNTTGVYSNIVVSGRSGNATSSTQVAVNIVHTYKGDLIVDLVAPDGSVYNLHNQTGGSTDNINTTYTVNLSSEAINGTWRLRARDRASGDTGYINSWSITM